MINIPADSESFAQYLLKHLDAYGIAVAVLPHRGAAHALISAGVDESDAEHYADATIRMAIATRMVFSTLFLKLIDMGMTDEQVWAAVNGGTATVMPGSPLDPIES